MDPTGGPDLWTDMWTQLLDPTHGINLWSLKTRSCSQLDLWIGRAWEVFDSWIVSAWSLKNEEVFQMGTNNLD